MYRYFFLHSQASVMKEKNKKCDKIRYFCSFHKGFKASAEVRIGTFELNVMYFYLLKLGTH